MSLLRLTPDGDHQQHKKQKLSQHKNGATNQSAVASADQDQDAFAAAVDAMLLSPANSDCDQNQALPTSNGHDAGNM